MGAEMPQTNKFLKYSIITILLMLVVLIGLTIAMIVLTATQGGPPDQDMCSMMPGLCPTSDGNQTDTPPQNPTDPHVPPYEIIDSPGYDEIALQFLTSVNFSVNPCEDFYEYACGQWKYQHTIPNNAGSYSEYSLVSSRISEAIKKSIDTIDVNDASEGLLKAKHFYDTCMNTTNIEVQKGTLLGKLLHTGVPEDPSLYGFDNGTGRWALIDKDYSDNSNISLEKQIAQLKSHFGIDTFWLPYSIQYALNSEEIVLWITPTMLPLGLGMFSQSFYLNPEFKYVMDAYSKLQESVAKLLARDSGFGDVTINKDDLKNMLNLEIDLANLTSIYSFDIEIQLHQKSKSINWNNNLWDLNTLKQKIPEINWTDYLKNLVDNDLWTKISVQNQSLIWIDTPQYYPQLKTILNSYKPRDIRNYNIWRLIKYSLPYMSTEYVNELSTFNSILQGRNVTNPTQSSVCLSYLKGNYEMPNLGFATAEAFIKANFFTPDEKSKATDMVELVKKGLEKLIRNSDWMDTQTKGFALKKVDLMDSSIAYPEWILNKTAQKIYYNDLNIPQTSFISLNLMLRGWAVRKQLSAIGVYFDRGEFPGSPLLTDAWYSASTNSLTVPLAEIQKPFFGNDYPDYVNYGATGAVLGHESSHGLDKNGANYDAYGNQTNWWTNSSRQAFNDHCNCLIQQFNQYCYPADIGCVNGNQTIDENVADLAGIKAAYQAYKQINKPQYRLANAPMWSDDQLFFLSFASYWCGVDTPQTIKNQINTDVHTPKKYRVIGTLRNVPEFSQAFNCPKDSYMNPSQRCSIW